MPNDRTRPGTLRPDGKNHGTVGNQITSPENVARAERWAQAAQLRAAGATFREIGRALDVDPTTAQTWVWRYLKEVAVEAADEMRLQEGQRLDRLQRGLWAQATAGDTRAVLAVLRIMERRARMFGLDMPVQVQVQEVPPALSQVEQELQTILGSLAD
jgi:hypothetical protein